MGKSYLKYEQSHSFGVVTSAFSNIVWAEDERPSKEFARHTGLGRAIVGGNEEILCWDIKRGELLSRWGDTGCLAVSTVISRSHIDCDLYAVGYADGTVRLWDAKISSTIIKFDGHCAAVTQLVFDKPGTRLASGSKDTDIIVWDLIAEVAQYKLRGHKDQITGLAFILPSVEGTNDTATIEHIHGTVNYTSESVHEYLLSTSKDALIKFWDLDSQYCVETRVSQSNGGCWALGIFPNDAGFVTGGNDGEIQLWSINHENIRNIAWQPSRSTLSPILQERGVIHRHGKDRTIGVNFSERNEFLAAHGSEKSIEILRIRSDEELQRVSKRKQKRRRDKFGNKYDGEKDVVDIADSGCANHQLHDKFLSHIVVRTGGKVRSVCWIKAMSNRKLQMLVSTTSNQLEVYSIPTLEVRTEPSDEALEYTRLYSIDMNGHKTDIRAIMLSSDDRMLATASNGTLKIWNTKSNACLRTLECGYALCCAFLPGDKIVVVGTKSGKLELFDIAASSFISSIDAHDGSIWSLNIHPDRRSVLSGGADKLAKFWEFRVHQEDVPGTKRTTSHLQLVHTRTLKVNDDVLGVCFSPDSRFLAVATLDNTVKIFFADSLKLYVNLYGHKLPVLHMSISSDSKLIATCSSDKNIRLWGLDFGDCHKAFFAHDDSILQIGFIPHPVSKEDNHLLFSCGKDHMLKSWDGDKFQHVQKLSGHHGEIWAMAVSRTGDFIVTASHDKSIRIWSRTEEQLFLEEERERELEEMYEKTITASLEKDRLNDANAAELGTNSLEIVSASKQTVATLNAGEKITEALTMCSEDLSIMREHESRKKINHAVKGALPQRNPILALRDKSADSYLLSVLEKIPSSALQDALLLLSFSSLPQLLEFLHIWLRTGANIQLSCRVLFFLLKTHHKQIVTSRNLRLKLEDIKIAMRLRLDILKDIIGFNIAATNVLAQKADNRQKLWLDEGNLGRAKVTRKRGFTILY